MEEISFEHISHRLRELRIARGLTQEYIANKLDINPSHISNIENGKIQCFICKEKRDKYEKNLMYIYFDFFY